MLKTYPTSFFLLPKRLKVLSLATGSSRRDLDSNTATFTLTVNAGQPPQQQLASRLSTDASLSSQPDPRQPTLLVSHAISPQTMASQSDSPPRQSRSFFSYFPLGYKDAVHEWWTSVTNRQAERNVLSFVPFLREASAEATGAQLQDLAKTDPFGHRVWRSSMVQLSGKNRALNELAIEHVSGEPADDTLVMLHGYGAGLGFFYRNFEPLSRVPGWRLYALDMLGMGNSARPPFRIHAKDPKEKIAEAESWFIDALEEWRKIRNIEKFTLLGHSMGGYLAVSYALKYPGRLNKLILASPVGIPEDPWAVNADLPEPEESTLANEFTQDQESIVQGQPAGANAEFVRAAPADKRAAASKPATATTPPKRPIPGWLVWLWDANVSPFSLVRLAGPLGPRFVSGWTSRRFNHLPPDEKQALHTYTYSLFRQRGSGEYALPYLLAPGAYARNPVINRIEEVGRQPLPRDLIPSTTSTQGKSAPVTRETGFPIVFLYGENDWMDVAAGYAAEEKLKQRAARALTDPSTPAAERERENGSAKVVVVRKAGHHLYLDNPEEFNAVVAREMEETSAWGRRERERRRREGEGEGRQ